MLPGRWAEDPLLVSELAGWTPLRAHGDDEALLVVLARPAGAGPDVEERPRWGPLLLALGTPERATDLLRTHLPALLTDLPRPDGAWVPPEVLPAVREVLVDDVGLTANRTGWEWLMATDAPAEQLGERDVVPVGPDRHPAVRDCLTEANPTTEADPAALGHRWWGLPDPADAGRLLGAIGAEPLPGPVGWPTAGGTGDGAGAGATGSGSWHLEGLGVRPSARGTGLGAALTSAAVRGCLAAGEPWVSLGMWDDNHGARRLYHRLGLRTVHRLHSLYRR